MDDLTAEAQTNQENLPETPWGPWQTAGLGLAVFVVFLFAQTAVVLIYVLAKVMNDPQADLLALAENAEKDGTLLSLAVLASSIAGSALIVLFAWLRSGNALKSYLGLSAISPRVLLICLGATGLFIVVGDSMTYFLDRPIVPEFMAAAYRSVTFKPLLWVAVCLAGPFFEELFFRGFLIKGWELSRLRPTGAVILSSVIFTGIHLQYDLYQLAHVLVLGLMFGFMRVKTGSTTPAFACHVFANFVATTETAILVS